MVLRPLVLLLLLLPASYGFVCRLTQEALSRRLPKGWRTALRSLQIWLECKDAAEEPAPPAREEDYLRDLEYPALFFALDLVKQDASEKLGFDVTRQSDYIEVDKVHESGPVGRWNTQKPRKALHRGDRVVAVNRVAGNATKMVNEMRKAVKIHLKVLRVSDEDHRALAKRRAAKELRKVMAIPPPPRLAMGLPEPAGSKVAALHARNVDPFLAQQPVTVLMIYAHWCSHCQQMGPEFTRAAELVDQMMLQQNVKFAKYDHGDQANRESDIGDPERLNVTSYPALFLITGGRHEQLSLHTAEELAAYVGARARGLDAEQEVKRVLLKTRPMLYRDDTPSDTVLDLEPETFDEEVLRNSSENNRVWIIEYYSDRCPFCRSLKPEYIRAAEKVRKELGGAVRFAAVNSRAFPDLAERFGVSSYPWIISVYAGGKGEDMVGLGGAETVIRWSTAQHKKLWAASPVWAKELPSWPASARSPPFELLQENNTGTWREVLGRRTWFLLHTLAARYPEQPSEADAAAARGLVAALGQHYPCPICQQHLQETLLHPSVGPVDTSSRVAFARWMCQLHNAVNKKLGKTLESCHAFELDLKYLKSCGECNSKVHIDESSTEKAEDLSPSWNYFSYLSPEVASPGRTEL